MYSSFQWLLVLSLLIISSTMVAAQKGKNKNNTKEKPAKSQPVKVNSKGASKEGIMAQLSGMNREEKNTMSRCPLHNKRMSLSDNYRADASDFRVSDGYPFAYQLNYRRYCPVCTKALEKEEKSFEAEEKAANKGGEATFERCELHGATLVKNGDHDPLNSEKSPQSDMPHAKQYLFKTYCKTCTKVYKIQTQ